MAIDPVQAVHSSAVVQNIEAVENAQRNPNPNPQGKSSHLPQDKVTISDAAKAHQAADANSQNRSLSKK